MPVIDYTPAWHMDVIAGRGFSAHDTQGNSSFVDVIGPGRQLANGFVLSPVASLGAIGGLPKLGGDSDKTIWYAGAGGRLNVWNGFFASFEVGVVSSRTPVFSSTYQFASSLGWSWKQFVVAVRHVSNGGMEGKNYGETMLLAGVDF